MFMGIKLLQNVSKFEQDRFKICTGPQKSVHLATLCQRDGKTKSHIMLVHKNYTFSLRGIFKGKIYLFREK